MANRFWVGGTGNWNDTNHWSDTDGTGSGFSVPGTGDDVKFTASSGGGTCTVNVSASCLSLDFTGYTGTLAGSSAIACLNNLKFDAGQVAPTYTGTISMTGSSTGKTITSAGKFPAGATLTINGTGGWTLQDAITLARLSITKGTFSSGGKQIDCSQFDLPSNSNTRAVTLSNSTINVSGTSTADFLCSGTSNQTGLTVTATSTVFNYSKGSGSSNCNPSGKTWGTLNISGTGGLYIMNDGTFDAFNLTNGTDFKPIVITAGKTLTVTGQLAASGLVSGTKKYRASFCSSSASTATISAGSVSLTNVVFRGITASGAASPFTGTDIQVGRDATNVTASSPRTLHWVGNAGTTSDTAHWSLSKGGSGGETPPGPNDTAIFDDGSFSSGSQTVTFDHTKWGSLTIAGVTNSPTFDFASLYLTFFGSISVDTSSQAFSNGGSGLYMGSSSNVTLNWRTALPANLYLGTVVDNVATSETVSFTCTLDGNVVLDDTYDFNYGPASGTLSAVSYNVTAQAIVLTAGTVNMGSGTWKTTGRNGSNYSFRVTTVTLNCETSTVEFSSAAKFQNFHGNSKTFYNVLYSGGGGSFYLGLAQTMTCASFTISGQGKTVKFTAGTTTTVSGAFVVSGGYGQPNILQGLTSANWSLVVNGTAKADYCTVSYGQASGTASPISVVGGTNGGNNNAGWTFTALTLRSGFLARI